MKIRRQYEPSAELNITPLIDVVFILLVFFMIATNFAAYRLIRIETPRETEVVKTTDGAIVIGVNSDGSFTFDNDPIERDMLPQKIAEIVAMDPGRVFLVRPGDDVSLQVAIEIYDVARMAGATSVSFSNSKDEERR